MKTLKPFGRSPGPGLLLSLGDTNPTVAAALAAAFADLEGVEVVEGNLLDLACDAIVAPANSFGDMSGGIDKAIDDFHQGEAQRRLRAAIEEQFFGELPVGAALVVEMPARRFPFVVAAPTMRIPGNIAGSINAYLALRAALVAVVRFNAGAARRILSLAAPGLGAGVGGMSGAEAAEQMRTAYESVVLGKWRAVRHMALAPYAFHPGVGLLVQDRRKRVAMGRASSRASQSEGNLTSVRP
jgi:O-acetyl-ADP-ribose deacetylase (regulator of RNase III)